MAITIERTGRRTYLRGDTYAAKDAIKGAGGHWDSDAKAWWLGDHAKAEAIVAGVGAPKAAPQLAPVVEGEAFVAVAGNTYPARDGLRALGGRWVADRKVWEVPASRLAAAQALVAGAPPAKAYRPTSCKQCGARPGPRGWPRIYRNGICSDCYAFDSDD